VAERFRDEIAVRDADVAVRDEAVDDIRR